MNFARRNGPIGSSGEDQGTEQFRNFRRFRPFLRWLQVEIRSRRMEFRMKDVMRDIQFWLEVMSDVEAELNHDLTTFNEQIINLLRTHPLATGYREDLAPPEETPPPPPPPPPSTIQTPENSFGRRSSDSDLGSGMGLQSGIPYYGPPPSGPNPQPPWPARNFVPTVPVPTYPWTPPTPSYNYPQGHPTTPFMQAPAPQTHQHHNYNPMFPPPPTPPSPGAAYNCNHNQPTFSPRSPTPEYQNPWSPSATYQNQNQQWNPNSASSPYDPRRNRQPMPNYIPVGVVPQRQPNYGHSPSPLPSPPGSTFSGYSQSNEGFSSDSSYEPSSEEASGMDWAAAARNNFCKPSPRQGIWQPRPRPQNQNPWGSGNTGPRGRGPPPPIRPRFPLQPRAGGGGGHNQNRQPFRPRGNGNNGNFGNNHNRYNDNNRGDRGGAARGNRSDSAFRRVTPGKRIHELELTALGQGRNRQTVVVPIPSNEASAREGSRGNNRQRRANSPTESTLSTGSTGAESGMEEASQDNASELSLNSENSNSPEKEKGQGEEDSTEMLIRQFIIHNYPIETAKVIIDNPKAFKTLQDKLQKQVDKMPSASGEDKTSSEKLQEHLKKILPPPIATAPTRRKLAPKKSSPKAKKPSPKKKPVRKPRNKTRTQELYDSLYPNICPSAPASVVSTANVARKNTTTRKRSSAGSVISSVASTTGKPKKNTRKRSSAGSVISSVASTVSRRSTRSAASVKTIKKKRSSAASVISCASTSTAVAGPSSTITGPKKRKKRPMTRSVIHKLNRMKKNIEERVFDRMANPPRNPPAEMEWEATLALVQEGMIGKNDLVTNLGLGKIKLESDYIPPEQIKGEGEHQEGRDFDEALLVPEVILNENPQEKENSGGVQVINLEEKQNEDMSENPPETEKLVASAPNSEENEKEDTLKNPDETETVEASFSILEDTEKENTLENRQEKDDSVGVPPPVIILEGKEKEDTSENPQETEILEAFAGYLDGNERELTSGNCQEIDKLRLPDPLIKLENSVVVPLINLEDKKKEGTSEFGTPQEAEIFEAFEAYLEGNEKELTVPTADTPEKSENGQEIDKLRVSALLSNLEVIVKQEEDTLDNSTA